VRPATRYLLLGIEILVVAILVLVTRCANYRDVFIAPAIYFTDADCYARMTRVRLCAQHPGLVIRHHSFENFPEGTTPHTTAPLDYVILLFSGILSPFTARPIDLAGALISPVLGALTGAFLCWWTWRMNMRFRWAALILFIVSPILVHGTLLGRPDHQSLLILLITVAICADWALITSPAKHWSVVSGAAWALALWVSLYEPMVLLLVSLVVAAISNRLGRHRVERNADQSTSCRPGVIREMSVAPHRRLGWYVFVAIIAVALLIERRIPALSIFVNDALFSNWSRSVGEMKSIPLFSGLWLTWLGWMIAVVPILLIFTARRITRNMGLPLLAIALLVVTFCLTMWQARWGYFLALSFLLVVPWLLGRVRWRWLAWTGFILSLWPVLAEWDRMIWPGDAAEARLLEQRREAVELRELSVGMMSAERLPFLAPWWQSPAIAYWSGQPGVAGSSHESLPGIADTARFYLETDPNAAGEILKRRGVRRVVAYDAERVETTSALILGRVASGDCMAKVLDYRATQAPPFLQLSLQNGTAKIFEVINSW
jgi:hypothetical protein